MKENINIKTAQEIEKMRIAGKLAADTMEMIAPHVKKGVTTDELNTICHNYMVDKLGTTPAPLNYNGFPKSICTSVNHQVCHGIPSDKKLKDGDIIGIDISLSKDGYFADTCKTFIVGKPSIKAERIVRLSKECLYLAINIVKPGVTLGDIGHTIEQHARSHNLGVVREFCGHGIGTSLHEDPQVLHYGKPGQGLELCEGMTFTIEPMINAGQAAVKILPDKWTVVTKDRNLSSQFEHTILVTENGCEVLTKRQEETGI